MVESQKSLFEGVEDVRTDKEKESEAFKAFTAALLSDGELSRLFPDSFSDKKFFRTLRTLYVDYVFNGAWSEDIFALCVRRVMASRNTLSGQTLGVMRTRIQREKVSQMQEVTDND